MGVVENIAKLNNWANECRLLLYNVEDNLDWRSVSAYNLGKNGGIGWIAYYNRLVLSELIESMQWFVFGYASSFDYSYWSLVHTGLIDEDGDITWKQICEAWVANDFEGRGPTIAIIDRMRQILWNEPYYVKWAARPEEEVL